MIPIKYNLRNMRIRWVTTTLTVLGTGLVVASSVPCSAWSTGCDRA